MQTYDLGCITTSVIFIAYGMILGGVEGAALVMAGVASCVFRIVRFMYRRIHVLFLIDLFCALLYGILAMKSNPGDLLFPGVLMGLAWLCEWNNWPDSKTFHFAGHCAVANSLLSRGRFLK